MSRRSKADVKYYIWEMIQLGKNGLGSSLLTWFFGGGINPGMLLTKTFNWARQHNLIAQL
jgi:hypothetical protein